GLADHQAVLAQVRSKRLQGGVDVAEVRRQFAVPLRRADTQEVHVTELARLLVGGGEPQRLRLQVLAQQRLEVGLVERHPALLQRSDLGLVDVHAEHFESEFGHTRRMCRAEVAGPDYRDLELSRCQYISLGLLARDSVSATLGLHAPGVGGASGLGYGQVWFVTPGATTPSSAAPPARTRGSIPVIRSS